MRVWFPSERVLPSNAYGKISSVLLGDRCNLCVAAVAKSFKAGKDRIPVLRQFRFCALKPSGRTLGYVGNSGLPGAVATAVNCAACFDAMAENGTTSMGRRRRQSVNRG